MQAESGHSRAIDRPLEDAAMPLVYLDDNHLSSTYVRTMTETLSERWFDATGW